MNETHFSRLKNVRLFAGAGATSDQEHNRKPAAAESGPRAIPGRDLFADIRRQHPLFQTGVQAQGDLGTIGQAFDERAPRQHQQIGVLDVGGCDLDLW